MRSPAPMSLIEVSEDLDNPHAQHVRLESIDLDE
jgi:hypothetical protein